MTAVHSMSMAEDETDAALLSHYTTGGSRAALAEIARRYIDLVYSAARRHTRDQHLADDVTQAVFLLLSQRARKISEPSRLVGWLYQTTHFLAANALKMQRRRRYYEQARAAQEPVMTDDADSDRWDDVAPLLEAAMANLDRRTRDLILMRYFQDKTVEQVASATGLSVHAAQKRLSRAIDQLRRLLYRRGITVPAAAVGTMLLSRSVEAAPAHLHQNILATPGALNAPTAGPNRLISEARRWMRLRRLRALAMGTVAICGAMLFWLDSSALPAAPAGTPNQAAAPQTPADENPLAPVSAWEPTLAKLPISKPWPLALPGCVSGAPIPADLFGDGKTEIVFQSMELEKPHNAIVHPHATKAALIYAINLDGTMVPGFPAQLASLPIRAKGLKNNPRYTDDWYSSPSVVKIEGKDVIAIPGPNLTALWDRALFIIRGDGSVQSIKVGDWKPDPNVPIIAVTLARDGPLELLGGYAEYSDGKFKRSRMQWNMTSGYDFSIGDANGDGELRIYQSAPRPNEFKTGNSVVFGWDRAGHMLPNNPAAGCRATRP